MAAGIALLERFDDFAPLRNGLRRVANDRDDWAGIPMPLDGERLVIHPKFPNADKLAEIGAPKPEPDTGERIRNVFWSTRLRCEIMIWNNADGSLDWGKIPGAHHFKYDLHTLGCSDVWGIEQEGRAVRTLGTLLKHRAFKQYLLTGMFIETSKRSGITYCFRKLKPTVAFRHPKILCTLCMHPIAHYAGTWAGAMCPTDDVIAHLMMMRGDEPMFWRRSNQHPPFKPEAGL